ncbi:ABC transporter [[Mycobacterium] wendilense]|uniref:ABC transporter n=1 Tax=[Mycobacterium] wendilense TaxID=3064284 RepID=A0ABM9MAX4_9MYCO|nr:ABC transporter [Mycolicibacterium sp. MU0050]CAJ1580713.1 ABC transporter [Mycolicibacterium sp. MU0050]
MTARTSARPAARHQAPGPGSALTGTWRVLRLALRRDRTRLAIWIGALALLVVYSPGALELAYPDEAARLARIDLLKTPAAMMLAGPMFGINETDMGVMMATELTLTLIVAASILAVLTVLRHTRAEEESGAAELILASVVGRDARIAAALLLAAGVNLVLAVLMTAALTVSGFALADSAGMSIGVAAAAMVFAAVAAVTAQLWRQSRTATGAALAVLAVAVLVRGVGDVIDSSGSALSWFSPIAWAQQMRPFADLRWWPLLLLVLLTAALGALAAALQNRRQYDAGTFASTGERPDARPIRGVLGLHLTLQRGPMLGWSVGLFLAGLCVGSLTDSMLAAAEGNELITQMLATEGTDGVYTTMSQFLAAAASAYTVAAVLRLSADERTGLAEPVLAGAVSRWRWLLTAVVAAALGSTVLMVSAGLGNGLGAGVTLGEPATIGRLTLAGLAYVPALVAMAGVAALAMALRRPWLGWAAVTFVITALYLGALLRLPQWLIDLSPVGRITAPLDVSAPTLVLLAAIGAALAAAAGFLYRNRDAA